MKKRILSILLMSAMLLGMTGCNSGTEAPESTTTDSAEVAAATTASKEDTVEATKEAVETEATTTTAKTEATTTTTTTTEEIVEEPVELPLVRDIICNNLPFYLSGYTKDNQAFVYDVAEKSIYIHDDNILTYFFDKYNCAKGNYLLETRFGEFAITNYKNCDVGLNEFNKDNEYENFKVLNHTIMPTVVVGSKEDFSGKVDYYGIIDENGEWLLPMTQTEIDFEEKSIWRCNSEFIAYLEPDSNDLTLYYYKEDRKELFEDRRIDGKSITFLYDNHIILCDGTVDSNGTSIDIYGIENNSTGIYSYNISTKEMTTITDKTTYYYLGNQKRYKDGVITSIKANYDGIYVKNEYNYDLSEYNGVSISEVNDNAVVFNAKNPNGTRYRLIMKKDGTLIGEPVESKDLITYLFDDKILSITASGKDRSLKHEKQIIDLETGEVTDISADYVVDSVIENEDGSCKLLVKSNNTYYYVEPTNFEKLVNVFEGVENVYTVEE